MEIEFLRPSAVTSWYRHMRGGVLLSDAIIEELEIEILSPKTGLWRFKGESGLDLAFIWDKKWIEATRTPLSYRDFHLLSSV